MANFKSLHMAQQLISHKNVNITSTMLGLSKKLVYSVTGATIKVNKYNYGLDAVTHLQRIIESDGAQLASAVKACRASKQEIGNIELDACISTDKQFVALQLLQFIDYSYRPISDVAFYEGEQAELVSSIIA